MTCEIDYNTPVYPVEDHDIVIDLDATMGKLPSSPLNEKFKRKLEDRVTKTKQNGKKNFEFRRFENSIMFVGHLSKDYLFVMEKPSSPVVATVDTQPVHRHIYGT